MNLATRKYNFIQELSAIDESFWKLEIIFKTSKKDWFTDLNSEENWKLKSV
jgi:hypothetical protein